MREKQKSQAHLPEKWDQSQVRVALAAARCHAARFARQRRLSRADREDLTQDILLAIFAASPRYDATRACWATFVALLARRAVIDRARQPSPPTCVSLDSEFATACRAAAGRRSGGMARRSSRWLAWLRMIRWVSESFIWGSWLRTR